MEATRDRVRQALGFLNLLLVATPAIAASYRTTNFHVIAPTEEIARQCAETAEHFRKELAIAWLGKPLPNWYQPCPMRVKVGQIGAGGSTTFTFDRGEVSGWDMKVQGSLERILDSVIPHEVNHTIFASYFRRPLPRWADEGAATMIEHPSERKRQDILLGQVVRTSRRIPLGELLTIREYPRDMQKVYTLYAEGYSLANFLVQQGGKNGRSVFLKFLETAHHHGWQKAIHKHYAFRNMQELEQNWTGWVIAGSPELRRPEEEHLADAGSESSSPTERAPASPRHRSPSEESADLALAPSHMGRETTSLASLSPLPLLTRQLRTAPAATQLDAPHPEQNRSQGFKGDLASISSSSVTLADHGRVLPRPAPLGSFAPSLRLQRIIRQTTAHPSDDHRIETLPRRKLASSVQRGQSPDPSYGSWSDYARFPGSRSQSDSVRQLFAHH